MSMILEMLGKGLDRGLLSVFLPGCGALDGSGEHRLCELIRHKPDDIDCLLRLAVHYARIAAIDRAEYHFGEILKRDPGHLETLLAWGGMHADAGDLDEAIRLFERAGERHSEESRVLFALGYCHERIGNADDAKKYYQAAMAGRPYLMQPALRLAAMAWHFGRQAEAIETYHKLQKENPEQVWIYLVLGQMYLETGEYRQAERVFERAITIEPDNFEMKHDAVEELAEAGRIAEAIEAMKKLIQEQADFPDAYIRLGDLYVQMGDGNEALVNYHHAFELHDGYLEAAVKLGTQYLRMQRYYEAAMHFNRAIEINDRLLSAYVGLGLSQAYAGNGTAATETFELALALEPNSHLLYAEVARVQLKLEQERTRRDNYLDFAPEGADDEGGTIEDLLDRQLARHHQAAQARPNSADIQYRYAQLLRGQGEASTAARHLQMSLQINPSFFNARIKLGLILLEQQHKEKAIEEFKQAWQLGEEFVRLHYKLGLMYCDKIHFALAVERFELTQDGAESSDAQANLRLALQNMGLVDRAGAIWRSVCELEPDGPMAFQAERSCTVLNKV